MQGYSSEVAVQILVYILKQKGIRKVVVSPGTTNCSLVASLQYDSDFELYSCIDEKSAAYMACGLAVESGEPVVISCTGATASREYLAGLTEAYYRKIPILAVTSTQTLAYTDHLRPQFIDRSRQPKDAVKYSTHIQYVRGKMDEWDCTIKINRAINELFKDGGGPVHINLTTSFSTDFSLDKLPEARVIDYYNNDSKEFPRLNGYKNIAISCGAKWDWNEREVRLIEKFCEAYNAVVIVDHVSGYFGKYRVNPSIMTSQEDYASDAFIPELLIHIGEQSGDYYTFYWLNGCKEVWRISPDGQIRDTFGGLKKIFDMSVEKFFSIYETEKKTVPHYYSKFSEAIELMKNCVPELPFSNLWLAKNLMGDIPDNSVIHFGMSNSLRSWTFFEAGSGVKTYANAGCRGIDGVISTIIGASFVDPDKIYYVVLGDLAFFYDINSLGNRHIGNNLRILLINNGGGTEMHLYPHMGHCVLGENVGEFVAADGHNGNKSRNLVKHYSQDLGFEYIAIESKEKFYEVKSHIISREKQDKSMVIEVFTNTEDESEALKLIRNLNTED